MVASINMHSRNHFRIRYPKKACPSLKVGQDSYKIQNLSEKGVIVDWVGTTLPLESQEIDGQIHFRDGVVVKVKGNVLRIKHTKVVIKLSVGIPFSIVIAEQRFLLHTFPLQYQ
jgi:hypothetical protein